MAAAWLHLTLAAAGHADQVDPHQLDRIVDRVRTAPRPPVTLAFDRVVVGDEAVVLVAPPCDELDRLRHDLATAIWDVLQDAAPRADPRTRFAPHVSLTYVNAAQPAVPVRAALDTIAPTTCTVTAPTLSLIEFECDNRAYQWRTVLRL